MHPVRVVVCLVGCCGSVGALAAQDPPDEVVQLAPEGRHAWSVSDEEFAAKRSAVVRRFEVPITESGALTLDLRSTQVDPLIRVLDASGTQLFLDDDSGIEWNAHLELQVEAGETLHLEGISQAPHGGELEFELRRGVHPLPSGLDLVEQTAHFKLGRGSFQVAIGQHLRGATDLHRAGEAFRNLRLKGLRHDTYTRMLAAVEQFDPSEPQRDLFEAIARTHLAATATVIESPDAGRAHLQRAEELAAQLGNPQIDALVRIERARVLAASSGVSADDLVRTYGELIQERDELGDAFNAAALRLSLVDAMLSRSRFDEAERWLLAARGIVDGLDEPKLATEVMLSELSLALGRGQLAAADALARRAVADAPLRSQRAAALIFLGDIETSRGRYGDAVTCLEEALALAEELPEPALRSAALQRMARVALELDDVQPAVVLLRESLAHVDGGALVPSAVERSLHLVYALTRIGRLDEADGLLDTIEASGVLAQHSALPLQFAESRASVAQSRGDDAATWDHMQRALRSARELELPNQVAHLLLEHAGIAREAGDTDAARAYVREGLALAESLGIASLFTDALVEASRLALAVGDVPEAVASFQRAEELVLEHWSPLLGARWGERLRAAERSERLARLGQDLAAAELALTSPGSAEWRACLAEGLRRADRWKGGELLRQRLAEQGADAGVDDLLAEVERRFAEHGCDLLHFAEGATELYAYTYSAGTWRHHALGGLAEIGAEVDGYLSHVARPASLGGVAEVAASGSQVYRRLLAPLRLGDAARDLVVVDSGVLAGLPLESLVSEAPVGAARFSELRFVLDDRRVSYAPSASMLVMPASGRRAGHARELVVLADPAFAAADVAGTGGAVRGAARVFPRLPGTRGEALAIARAYLSKLRSEPEIEALLGGLDSGSRRLDASGLHLRLGEEATREALLELVEDAAIVHLATHGVQDPREPRRSALALAPSAGGAGELYLSEILDWDLSADLAVLSACETASGSVRHGEGMRSLAWSFLRAGADAVVATLWQVDDRESEALMRDFYAEFLGDHDASAALQDARLGLRNASAEKGAFLGVGRGKRVGPRPAPSDDPALAGHPFFWASFVHVRARLDAGEGASARR